MQFNFWNIHIIQIFVDWKRQRHDKLILRYYRYSISKIINQTEKDFNRMKNTYIALNQAATTLKNNKQASYNDYLQKNLKKLRVK